MTNNIELNSKKGLYARLQLTRKDKPISGSLDFTRQKQYIKIESRLKEININRIYQTLLRVKLDTKVSNISAIDSRVKKWINPESGFMSWPEFSTERVNPFTNLIRLIDQNLLRKIFLQTSSLKPAFSESIYPFKSLVIVPLIQPLKICSNVSEAITLCR